MNVELIRGPHEIQCAKHIVADRLLGAVFHERHMFVRRGMKTTSGRYVANICRIRPLSRIEAISTFRLSRPPY